MAIKASGFRSRAKDAETRQAEAREARAAQAASASPESDGDEVTKEEAEGELSILRARLANVDADWARNLVSKLPVVMDAPLPQQGLSSSELNSGSSRLKTLATQASDDQPTNTSPEGQSTPAEERQKAVEASKKLTEERKAAADKLVEEQKAKAEEQKTAAAERKAAREAAPATPA